MDIHSRVFLSRDGLSLCLHICRMEEDMVVSSLWLHKLVAILGLYIEGLGILFQYTSLK